MSALFYPPQNLGHVLSSNSPLSQDPNGDSLRYPFSISLQGLSAFDYVGMARSIPMQQRFIPQTASSVNCLKVVSVWENARHPIGFEIEQWTRIFRNSLEDQCRVYLFDALANYCQAWLEAPSQTVPNLAVLLRDLGLCQIEINTNKLVGDMLNAFFKEFDDDSAVSQFPWTYSRGNLSHFIYTFVHAMDCFTTERGSPSMIADFALEDLHGALPHIKANVKPYPVHFKFVDLPVSLPAGAEYIIKPEYTPATIWDQTRYWIQPHCSVAYNIEQFPFPLIWDDEEDCFRAQVPLELIREGPQDVIINFNARLEINFPQDVVFVETATFELKLRVFRDENATGYDSPENHHLVLYSSPMLLGGSSDASMKDSHMSGKRKASETLNETRSPQKRPAMPKLVKADSFVFSYNGDYSDSAISVPTNRERAPEGHKSWNFGSSASHSRNSRDPRMMLSHFVDNAPLGMLHRASQSSSSATPSPVAVNSASGVSAASSHTELSQAEIQANYAEFERKMLHRVMKSQSDDPTIPNLDGVVSPDDEFDVERKEFEDFLLEDSDADLDFDDDN